MKTKTHADWQKEIDEHVDKVLWNLLTNTCCAFMRTQVYSDNIPRMGKDWLIEQWRLLDTAKKELLHGYKVMPEGRK